MAKSKRSYQELKSELDGILSQLQHEDTDIDAAVEMHKKGLKILEELEAYLQTVAEEAELDIKIKRLP